METKNLYIEEKPVYTKVTAIQRLNSYILKQPLYITLEIYEDEALAEHPDTESWATGESDFDAIDGIRYEIEDLYNHLKETPDENLGRKLLQWKRLLLSIVEDIE